MRRSPTDAIFVGFAGRIGAGKTSAAQYLSTKYGFQYTRYSQVLCDWFALDSRGRRGLQQFGWEVMASGRQVELNARVIAEIDRSRSAAIDGLRHPIDFHSLSYALNANTSFHLVFLDAAAEIRYRRKPTFSTYEAFLATDTQTVEAHIDDLKPLASLVLPNEASFESLCRQLEDWLTSYKVRERT